LEVGCDSEVAVLFIAPRRLNFAQLWTMRRGFARTDEHRIGVEGGAGRGGLWKYASRLDF